MKTRNLSRLLLAIFVAAGALGTAGCGARIDAGAPVVTYYYVPG